MTNNQKIKTEIIEVWSSLKEKLSKLIYLNKNKSLIKEAVKFHMNQASSFTTNWFCQDMPSDYQKANLLGDNIPKVPKPHPEWDEYYKKLRWNGYLLQKDENEKIVRECKELLSKLE